MAPGAAGDDPGHPQQRDVAVTARDVDAVRRLLSPRSMVLVGASHKGGTSTGLLRNLLEYTTPERFFLVNPSGGEISGIPCHRSVSELPEPVDVALVVVPADHVAGV